MEEKKVEIKLNPSRKIIRILSGILFVLSCTGAAIAGSAAIAARSLFSSNYNWILHDDSDKYNGLESAMKAISDSYDLDRILQTSIEIAIICIIAAVIFAISSIIFTDKKDEMPWYDRIYSDVQLFMGIMAGCASIPAVMVLVSGIGYGWFGEVVSAYEKIFEQYKTDINVDFYSGYGMDTRDVIDPTFMLGLGIFMAVLISLYELHIIKSLTVKIKNGTFLSRTFLGYILGRTQNAFQKNNKTKSKWMILSFAIFFGTLFLTGIGMASESGFIVFLVAVLWILAIIIIEPKFFDRYAEIKNGIKKLAGGDTDSRITRTNDNTELDELAGDINDISEAVKNAVEKEVKNERMKSALISNVSHDLKTPLTSMVSYIDLLKKEGLDSENAPEYLRILDEKTNRLKDLTLDLFDAAKAASGDLPVDLQKIDLGSIVNQEVAEFQDVLEEKNIEIVINEQEPHIMAMADGRHLSRVLDNLLNNIKKYAMENSRAYIDITSNKTITVKNISRDKLNISAEELMERFTRGDASRNTEGSGLGLAIARDLTNLMGGKFDIIIDGDLFKAEIGLHFPEE